MYDVSKMQNSRDFYWRHDKYDFVYSRSVNLPKNPRADETVWTIVLYKLKSGGVEVPFQRREYRRRGIKQFSTVFLNFEQSLACLCLQEMTSMTIKTGRIHMCT